MELIRGIHNLRPEHRPSVASIGNFDGVHLGHKSVIRTLMTASHELGVPATVITFDPLAKEFFAPDAALRLSTVRQRAERMGELGVDRLLVIEFNESLAAYSPEKFVQQILVDGLGLKYLSVGDDFRFGKNRAGDFNLLRDAGASHGFEVCAHKTFKLGGERVSSGRLREAIKAGDFISAKQLLGEPYTIAGSVETGQRLGRTIGFPTANIELDAPRFAVQGVYAVQVNLQNGVRRDGVANVGIRPTVAGKQNRLEVHLFDFEMDLYDQRIEVEFVAKVRDEQKFPSIELLTEQIAKDTEHAKRLLLAAKKEASS
jgi:riboflavin kinase/FMN adenylyltransferase